MSLLQEAREKIAQNKKSQENLQRQQDEYNKTLPQRQAEWKKENEEREKLSAELISESKALLMEHGTLDPDPSRNKGILGKVKTFLEEDPFRKLVATLKDGDEESVTVTIESRLDLKKSYIIIQVQEIETHLFIPADRKQSFMVLYENRTGHSAQVEDLRSYREVLNRVREKLGPPKSSVVP